MKEYLDCEKDYGINKKVVLYQLAFHCELMYDYLTETGKKVPEAIGKELSDINQIVIEHKEKYLRGTLSKEEEILTKKKWTARRKTRKEEQKRNEINCLEMQLKAAEKLDGYKKKLPEMFNELTTLCAPSTPCTLENTIPTHKIFFFFGQKTILFLRDLGTLSLLFLFSYSLLTWWYTNFVNQMVFEALLVCAAGTGACFYSLNSAKRFVVSRTFDDKYIPHYYNRIIIGVIAGSILANFIDLSTITGTGSGKSISQLTPSLIALLGGFSSDFVVRLLNRLLAMIQTLIEGDAREIIENKAEQIKLQAETSRIKQNLENITKLKSLMDNSEIKSNKEACKAIDELINKMLEIK
jgi:hypothetical protein